MKIAVLLISETTKLLLFGFVLDYTCTFTEFQGSGEKVGTTIVALYLSHPYPCFYYFCIAIHASMNL